MEHPIKSSCVYEGRILTLKVDVVRVDGRSETAVREVVLHRPAVAIIAIEEDQVLLVRQFRYAVGAEIVEIPAGLMETGEDPQETARRELREETGYDCRQLRYISSAYSTPGFSSELIHLYLATDLFWSPLTPDADESITVTGLPIADIQSFVTDPSQHHDCKTLMALWWLLAFRDAL